ncbi:MAG: hypothetical protein JKX68_07830 [Flavobacteriales bacterium]|nr:hypothetical protein [Flavobacteriales bacterium]
MKTVLVTVAIIFSSAFTNVYGGNNLKEQINETVKFKSLNIEKNKTEFVRISFKINEEGQVTILEMNYSNEKVKNQLIKQLKGMKIYGIIDINEVYSYKFSFIKL